MDILIIILATIVALETLYTIRSCSKNKHKTENEVLKSKIEHLETSNSNLALTATQGWNEVDRLRTKLPAGV